MQKNPIFQTYTIPEFLHNGNQILSNPESFGIKEYQKNLKRGRKRVQSLLDALNGDPQRVLFGIAVYPGGDQRKGHAFEMMFLA
jgi:hypothetical protein